MTALSNDRNSPVHLERGPIAPGSELVAKEKQTFEHLESGPGRVVSEYEEGTMEHHNSPFKTFMALLALSMSFGSQLGVGSNMTPSVLAQIAAAYDATAIQGWISSGWLLSTCVAFVVAGRLSDIFGRRVIITGSNVLAVAGFAICAFAPNFSVLIGGIILLGFAGGLAQTATAAACEIVPNKYRPVAIAFLELAIAPTGYLSGSTFAHLIVAYSTFKWIFRLGMILCGVAFFLCLFFYHPPPPVYHLHKTRWQLVRELDYVGIGLFSAGLGVFLMGVIWAGGQYSSTDLHVILPIVLGLVSLVAFAFWEIHMGDSALMPPRLFKGRTRDFTLPIVCHFVAGTVFFGQIALWPLQSAYFYGRDLIDIGLLGLPAGVAVFVGGCVIGPLIPKIGPTNRQLQVAMVLIVASVASMAALTPTSKAAAIALQVLSNLPFHVIVNLCFLSVQFSQEEKDIGVAVGLCGASRSLGGTVGVSVYLTILGSQIPKEVPASIASAIAGQGLPASTISALIADLMAGDPAAAATLPGMTTPTLQMAVSGMNWGYQNCFKVVYLSTLGFGIPGIIAAMFVKDVSEHFTSHTAVSLDAPHKPTPEGKEVQL